jgi:hypothetical protein
LPARRMAIIAKPDALLIRGIFQSRRIPIEQILDVAAIEQPSMYGMGGMTIAIHTASGRRIVAGEFWSPVSRTSKASRIEAIVGELEKWRKAGVAHPPADLATPLVPEGKPQISEWHPAASQRGREARPPPVTPRYCGLEGRRREGTCQIGNLAIIETYRDLAPRHLTYQANDLALSATSSVSVLG